MVVSKLICPECNTVLKPAKPLPAGKPVKCPECGTRFVVPEEEAPKAPLKKPKKATAAGPEASEPKPKMTADLKKGSPKKPAEKKAAATGKKPASKKTDDDEEEGGVYGYIKEEAAKEEDKPDIEYAPDMSTKDLRGPAASALVQPSNALIVVGGLGFLGWLGLIVLYVIPVVFPIDNDEGDKTKQPKPVVGLEHGLQAVNDSQDLPAEPKEGKGAISTLALFFMLEPAGAPRLSPLVFFVYLFVMALGMTYSGLVTYGAVKIQNLEGYRWGVASCIMAIVSVLNLWGLASCTKQLVQFLLGMVIDDPGFLWGVLIFLMSAEMATGAGVGAWVLVTLRTEKVIKGYEYKAE